MYLNYFINADYSRCIAKNLNKNIKKLTILQNLEKIKALAKL